MNLYDCILIGGGPAAMSASIYLGRAGYKVAFIEKSAPGGKVIKTGDVENYPGFSRIYGPDLGLEFFNHTQNVGVEYFGDEVESISKNKDDNFAIKTSSELYNSKTLIIATGMKERRLGAKNEIELEGRGVSGCAICDAPLFKGKTMTFVGGGKAAIGEALHVINFAGKINLVHRRDFFRANKPMVKKLLDNPKVTPYLFYKVDEFIGKDQVEAVNLVSTNGKKPVKLETSVVFPYIGADPNTKFIEKTPFADILNKENYIAVDVSMKTKHPGLFAIGDVIDKEMRQIVTAVSDGAIASKSVISFLEE